MPGPIDLLRGLALAAPDAVVTHGATSPLQWELYVEDGLDLWVEEELRRALEEAATQSFLIVLSGNAGDGKSMLIEGIAKRLGPHPSLEIIFDATHADTPTTSQAASLARGLAAFADVPAGGPSVVLAAMNVGMAVRFFDHSDEGRAFRALREEVLWQLRVVEGGPTSQHEWLCKVVNLGSRSLTAGGDDERPFLDLMIDRLDPALSTIMKAAAAECEPCSARSLCFTHLNVQSLSLDSVRGAFRDAIAEAELVAGVHATPRAVWDLCARSLASVDAFPGGDPSCDGMRKWAAEAVPDDEELLELYERMLPNRLFARPRNAADLGLPPLAAAVEETDPLARAGQPTFENEAAMLADTSDVAGRLSELATQLGDSDGLLQRVADYLTSRLHSVPPERGFAVAVVGALPRFAAVFGVPQAEHLSLKPRDLHSFERLLVAATERPDEIPEGHPLQTFYEEVLLPGLQLIFGILIHGDIYIKQSSLTAQSKWLAYAPLPLDDMIKMPHDEVAKRSAVPPRVLRYRATGIPIQVTSAEAKPVGVTVDLRLYRMLKAALSGASASADDRESFFRLTYALERVTATHPQTMAFRQVGGERLLQLAARQGGPAGRQISLQEIRP